MHIRIFSLLVLLFAAFCSAGEAHASECTNQVPAMTNSTTPSGVVTNSGNSPLGWQAFDSIYTGRSSWLSKAFETPAWIAYDFGTSTPIDRYTIRFANGSSLTSRAPRDWQFQGWNGSSWDVLDVRSGETGWLGSETRRYALSTTASYSKYRLWITDDNDVRAGVVVISISELELEACSNYLVDDFEDGDFDGWTLDGIGHANQVSAEVVDDGGNKELALTSDGATAYIQKDNAGFLYRSLTGDFRIEADVDTSTMTTGQAFRKAGLMARASLDDEDLRLLAMHLPVQERLQFAARDVYAGAGNVKVAFEVGGVDSIVRLAIERSGQNLSVQYSLDGGATWITPTGGLGGSIEIVDLPETLLVGVAVVSNDISVTSTALFDDILISPAP